MTYECRFRLVWLQFIVQWCEKFLTRTTERCIVQESRSVGVFSGEGPPVPIPNTEVKLTCADNTCLATSREDRSTPTYASLAQSVEHAAVNRGVVGSSPTGGAMKVGRHFEVAANLL